MNKNREGLERDLRKLVESLHKKQALMIQQELAQHKQRVEGSIDDAFARVDHWCEQRGIRTASVTNGRKGWPSSSCWRSRTNNSPYRNWNNVSLN